LKSDFSPPSEEILAFYRNKNGNFAKLVSMNLYDFAAFVRRAVVYLALGIVAATILYFLYKLAVNIYLTLNPPPETPPTVGFGKLPKLRLPQLEIKGDPSYTLDTPTGALPEFDDRAVVLAMLAPQPTLLAEEKARSLARALDFGGEGDLSVDKRKLTFEDLTDKRTLTVDLTTQNFVLSTSLEKIASLSKGLALSGPEAIKKAQEILSQLGLQKFGFEAGNQTTNFQASQGSATAKVSSISEAQFTEVNFYRSLTEVSEQNFPILPIDQKKGLIQVWVSSEMKPEINNIFQIIYNAQEAEVNKSGTETYPLKNVMDAWEEVKSGQGTAYIGSTENLSTVQITSITLAYFDDAIRQDYMQPIYVFSGVAKTASNKEVEFVAYSQAVSKDWTRSDDR
jgi:hypothetical protein